MFKPTASTPSSGFEGGSDGLVVPLVDHREAFQIDLELVERVPGHCLPLVERVHRVQQLGPITRNEILLTQRRYPVTQSRKSSNVCFRTLFSIVVTDVSCPFDYHIVLAFHYDKRFADDEKDLLFIDADRKRW